MSLDSEGVAVISAILIMYERSRFWLLNTSSYDLTDFSIGSVLSISGRLKSYVPTSPDRCLNSFEKFCQEYLSIF